jgi:hypothetical protein
MPSPMADGHVGHRAYRGQAPGGAGLQQLEADARGGTEMRSLMRSSSGGDLRDDVLIRPWA